MLPGMPPPPPPLLQFPPVQRQQVDAKLANRSVRVWIVLSCLGWIVWLIVLLAWMFGRR